MKIIDEMYEDFEDKEALKINKLYFVALYKKFLSNIQKTLTLKNIDNDSNVFPMPIASKEQREYIHVKQYADLSDEPSSRLKSASLRIVKMQAGLGTSVERLDLIKKYDNRTTLGSKGTDLFISYQGKMISIAEAQLLKASEISKTGHYKEIKFQNLINSETEIEVNKIWQNRHISMGKSYQEVFNEDGLMRLAEIYQLMMPTLDGQELTVKRTAPAGHGFLGFHLLYRLFTDEIIEDEIITIGNGEDLQSTTDDKIHSWMLEDDIAIAMITTTKTAADKKGGQLAVVMEKVPYVTIVEKAQAQQAGQLEYFTELGLREGDDISLFNTNIVVINVNALKKKLKMLKCTLDELCSHMSPDLIQNTKEQDGAKYTQLEGAIGSLLLNLDKYSRQKTGEKLVSFLNLSPKERRKFFVPIKKREDFEELYKQD